MEHDELRLSKVSPKIMAVWRWLMLAPIGVFVIYVALRGISESFDNGGFPEALLVKLELLPIIFPVPQRPLRMVCHETPLSGR